MTALGWLFWANILILVPIGFGTLLRPSSTDQGVFPESAGWRTLVGSLWLAILAMSVLGVRQPEAFRWLLVFQAILLFLSLGQIPVALFTRKPDLLD